jgi:hypothetical protein
MMKTILALLLLSTVCFGQTFQTLKVGSSSPINASALLEVQGTTGAFLIPRMTTTQKNAISGATNGDMVYDTTLGQFSGYAAGSWAPLGGSTLVFADSLVNTANTVTLVNDSASPGASQYYGTNASSTLGYFALPTSAVWGLITGTLSSQTDLNTALGLKAPLASPTFTGTITTPLSTGMVKSTSGGLGLGTAGTDYVIPSGSITGTSGNITGTSNSTLTALSSLSSVDSGVTANFFLASPNGSSGVMTPRSIVAADIPTLNQNTTGNATTATTATNIASGANGSVPYQTGSGATSMLATGTGVLIGGTPPSYTTTPTLAGIKDTSNVLNIEDSTDTTKIIALNASGNTTGKTLTISSGQTNSETLTIPNITGADTIDTLGLAQTLGGTKTFTNAPTFSSVTASQALVVNGSKALASNAYSTTAAASTLAEWDANVNLTSNANFSKFTTTATAAGTTALTITSPQLQAFTGSTTQTVTLPTTSVAAGNSWSVWNYSSGVVTLEASGGATIQAIAANYGETCAANTATPTIASGWDCIYYSLTGTGGTPSFTGLNQYGGMYAATTTTVASTAAGTTGQVLTATTSAAPAFAAPVTNNYWSGYHPNGDSWSVTSTTFADFTSGGTTPAITTRKSNGITVTTASGSLPGITWTPSSTRAVYLITAVFSLQAAASQSGSLSLTDGTTVIVQNSTYTNANVNNYTLTGIYSPASASAVTVKIRGASSSGVVSLYNYMAVSSVPVIEWSLVQIE